MAPARPPRTSVRRRVTLGVLAVVVLGLAAAGVTSVLALRATLVQRTDDRLAASRSTVLAVLDRPTTVLREGQVRRAVTAGLGDAAVHLVAEGEVVASIAAGDVGPVPDAATLARLGDDAAPSWLPGDAPVRAVPVATPGLVVALEDGTSLPVDALVVAQDTSDDRATVRSLIRIELLAGVAVAGGALVLSWTAVGRGLRPLARMAADAARVAAGERDVRLSRAEPVAETAALAAALDDALDRRAAAEDRLRAFVADAAHELRTPLTSVQGWADLHLQGALDADGVDRAMDSIGREGRRMRHVVDQLALLARLDADLPLEALPVDLRSVVGDALADLDVLDPGRPVTLTAPDGPVTVTGDRERLAQVVHNLVANVLRHTPPDAGLAVRLAADGDDVVLDVHDDGPGMAPALAARAFERFAHGPGQGSGLGLAIVAAVARAHGGSASLEPAAHGTTVRVRLPRTGAGASTGTGGSTGAAPPPTA